MRKSNVLKFLDKYFDPSLDLRVQTFNLLAFAGTAAGVAAAMLSFITGIIANGFINLAMSGLALLFVHRARKKNNYRFYYRLTVILVFMLAFPYMFFEGTEKVDSPVYIWYNVCIKYRRCFYGRSTTKISIKPIHGNI